MGQQKKTHGVVIESSSGNLGVALSIICAAKGYQFICVVDPNVLPSSEHLMRAYGTEVVKVTQKDANGGYLATRIDYIHNRLRQDSDIVWLNQYENFDNVESHYLTTGPAIIKQFPQVDFVFIGAGTTGTLAGVSQFLRERAPSAKIIAVDSVGSVNFDQPAGKRVIPGLGASRPMPINQFVHYDTLISVTEKETVDACHKLARKGLLLGGSSGTILSAIKNYQHQMPPKSSIVAIAPDFGERYLNTIYNPEWVFDHFSNCRDQAAINYHFETGVSHEYA